MSYRPLTNTNMPSGIDAAKLADGSVSNAELQYLDGVTSGIQAQIAGLSNVGCTAYRTTNFSGTTTPTAMTFDSEISDLAGYHSNSSNTSRFTIPSGKGGLHLVIFPPSAVMDAQTNARFKIYVNGSFVTGLDGDSYVLANYPNVAGVVSVLNLVDGDYVEIFCNGSGNFTIYSGTGVPSFTIVKLT